MREVLEGFGNEVRKRDVPGGPGGVPGAETQGGGGPDWKESLVMGRTTGGAEDRSHPPRLLTPRGVGGFRMVRIVAQATIHTFEDKINV